MENVDLLIKNATILTMDSQDTIARSVAVTNGMITHISLDDEPDVSEMNLSSDTKVLDLKNKTLIPGFIDTHNHIIDYAQNQTRIDCSTPPNRNIQDILDRVAEKAKENTSDDWIIGYGYDDSLLSDHRHPTASDLDKVAPDHPVFISHISGHIVVVNSVVLEMIDTKKRQTIDRSLIGESSDGDPNGVFYEAGADFIRRLVPKPDAEELAELIIEASKQYMSQGITTSTDAAVGSYLGSVEIDAHLKAATNGKNPLRHRLLMMHDCFQEDGDYAGYTAEMVDNDLKEKSNGMVRLDGAKFFQDGSIQGYTGALREPYHRKPDVYGELVHDQEMFNDDIYDLHKRGFRIAVHGNGDRAIGSILEAFRHVLEKSPKQNHRHRIEHVQTATPQDLIDMEELNVAGSFFINHVYYWGDRHKQLFLGPERAERINPIADAIHHELLFTLHSDCPITPISPLFSVWAAVNRVTKDGDVLGAAQRCDVMTALKSMTIYGAQLNFEEERTGSIEIGKQADFAVLDRDPRTVDPMTIKDIKVLETIIAGESVYIASEAENTIGNK